MTACATSEEKFLPSISFMSMRGDVSITWNAENREFVKALIEKKMKEGYSFFVVVPRKIFGIEMPKVKTKITPKNLEKNMDRVSSVTMKEDGTEDINLPMPEGMKRNISVQNEGLGYRIDTDDKDIDIGLRDRQFTLARVHHKETAKAVRKVVSAEELLDVQSVAVRPVTGG